MANTSTKVSFSVPDIQLSCIDGKTYIPEQPFKEEKTKFWETQVLIPFTLGEKPLAFLVPLPSEVPSTITPH